MSNPSKQKRKTNRWAQKQNSDQFVKQARQSGYRARAVYKLESIDQKYRLLKAGQCVVDLGCAPGSWCQYAVKKVMPKGYVIGIDLLAIEAVSGVEFIQGDFNQPEVVAQAINCLGDRQADIVLSDMAPNITGIKDVDQARFETLFESIMGFCQQALMPGGDLLMKVFVGSAFDAIKKQLQHDFTKVSVIKPDASRGESKECFLLSQGFIVVDD